MIKIDKAHARVVPQVHLALEAVRLGEIEAREAFTNLIIDAEILVDDAELQKIKDLPEMAAAMKSIPEPNVKHGTGGGTQWALGTQERERAQELAKSQETGSVPKDVYGQKIYTGSDWRAKVPEIRKAQFKQKPVIDYVASTYKGDVLKAVAEKFSSLPDQWRQALMAKPAYRLETKGLQLSPTADKKWKSIFVQIILDLGSGETGDGFIGKLVQEFDQALANGQVQEAADGLVWKSSLTGLETMFKNLDPYAGTKPSSHQIQGHDVARWGEKPHESEPGYDLHVKEGILDHIQNALAEKLTEAMGVSVESVTVSDDGVFVFKAAPPEPATEPERMADDIEEESL